MPFDFSAKGVYDAMTDAPSGSGTGDKRAEEAVAREVPDRARTFLNFFRTT